ncbi:hypothetical protein L1F30_07910 [Simiduia sp. 21SJ11W-1]|uniref:hypothetical protein n=1 Tax=Simiduia sp. 21SJ11W-1 TaxID=2909669 RepID=UPI0020A0AD37|nr:hypothetical protein [Simiduia sp. 21SJ11W-1]UTA49449.1 hypothetical protein L1F30_07910 [Simiduia sp. 21SJ11W-1]
MRNYNFISKLLLLCVMFCASSAFAQDGAATPAAATLAAGEVDEADKGSGVDKQGLNVEQWGLALGVAVEGYSKDYVKSAGIYGTDKIVVVDESFSTDTTIWAVGNWTVDTCFSDWRKWVVPCSTWVKPGIFFGLKLGGQDGAALEGMALGLQWSFLQNVSSNKNDGKKPSWNLGVGLVQHETQSLANGIVDGAALPGHFQQIQYKKGSDTGFVIMLSKNIY